MRKPIENARVLAFVLAALLAAAPPAALLGQAVPAEGYDPLRQITAQLVKANLLIVQDVSGSMAWDMPGNTLGDSDAFTKYDGANFGGEDVTGRLFWTSTFPTSSNVQGGSQGNIAFNARVNGNQTVGGTSYTNNSNLNVAFNNVAGVGYPGIYVYSSYTTTAPNKLVYRDYSRNGGPSVYAVNMPVMSYDSGSGKYRLVYRCKPVGTWTDGGVLPWSADRSSSTGIEWQYNNSFDTNDCSLFTWELKWDSPSRLNQLKNALGNSVYIVPTYTPPPITIVGSPVSRWPSATAWRYDTPNYTGNPWTTWLADDNNPSGRRNALTTNGGKWFAYREGYKLPAHEHDFEFKIEPGFNLQDRTVIFNPTTTNPLAIPKPNVATGNYVKQPGSPFKAFYTSLDADLFVPTDSKGAAVLPMTPIRPLPSPVPSNVDAKLWSIGLPRPGFGVAALYEPPQDVIGRNASRINFGLETYSGDGQSHNLLVPIDVTDGTNVERLEGYFAPNTNPLGAGLQFNVPKAAVPVNASDRQNVTPLGAGGSTPTRGALIEASEIITSSFKGTAAVPLATANSSTWSLPADPKRTCNRPYGVVLATDGMSNNTNPSNRNWVNPCGSAADGRQCDSGAGYDCPLNWANHAASISDQIWNTELDPGGSFPKIRPRTWVIGMSTAVGPCELDFIAYMGRTDASSPSGDAGFSGYRAPNLLIGDFGNPNLPDPASTVAADPVGASSGNFVGPNGQRKWNRNTSKWFKAESDPVFPWLVGQPASSITDPPTDRASHNAFFATSAKAIGDAFTSIVNATATGDYATNAPVSGMSAQAANIVYLPSTEFPSWKGHVYAFDISKDPADAAYVVWEAGSKLLSRDIAARKIFTWNPATGNSLVEVTQANLSTLQSLGGAGVTASVVDFIRGNDGSLTDTKRNWVLAPMINSAPALVAKPENFLQNNVLDHKAFQLLYASRDPLLWVGGNDGMMHAFQSETGIEQIALLPPSLLATQVTLYNNYVNDPAPKIETGQVPDLLEHVYGVANSFRFGDVYDTSLGSYRTVGYITLGPGGTDVVAVDVTKVPAPDAAPYPASPVSVLWTKTTGVSSTGAQLERLGETWSIPAVGPVSASKWRLVMGSGFTPGNNAANQLTGSGFTAPRAYVLDPTNGTVLSTKSLSSLNSPTPWVGNQAFADAVIFDPKAKTYQDDNLSKMGLQADLNGRIWFLYDTVPGTLTFDAATVGIDVSTDVSPVQSQPLYYNPAASGYGASNAGCVAYAFGSGALYETSSKVTGSAIGTSPNFIPRLYVALNEKTSMTAKVPAGNIAHRTVQGSWPSTNAAGDPITVTVGPRTQLTGPPFLLVPKSGTGKSLALFLLYDPDLGCNGYSYVATVEFEGNATCTPDVSTLTYKIFPAGVGAASGFTIAGDKVLVSKSGIGEGKRASIFEPPNITAAVGNIVTPKVKWWKELK